MNTVYKCFTVGSSESMTFNYTGFQISQTTSEIAVDQFEYVEKMKINSPGEKKGKTELLSEDESTMFRSNVGALQWVARGTRPELGFESIDLSTRFSKATHDKLQRSIKALKRLKLEKEQCKFVVPHLGRYHKWKLEVSTMLHGETIRTEFAA